MQEKAELAYLANFVSFEILFFIVALASIVFYLILTGKINTKGLLIEKNKNRNYSLPRVQLLVITLLSVVLYLIEVKHNVGSGKLPQVSEELLLIVGGSDLFYLGSKFHSLLLHREIKFTIQAPK